MEAATARAVAFEEKVTRADAIVLGECIDTELTTDPSGRWIITKSKFRVRRSYKGAVAGEIEIVTPGGSLNGVHQETIGIPKFRRGDLDILFVNQRNAVGATVLYFDQGRYRVSEDGGTSLVAPAESDLVLIDMQSGKAVPRETRIRTLDEFERDVSAILDQTRRRGAVTMAASPVRETVKRDWRDDAKQFARENSTALTLLLIGCSIAAIATIRRLIR